MSALLSRHLLDLLAEQIRSAGDRSAGGHRSGPMADAQSEDCCAA